MRGIADNYIHYKYENYLKSGLKESGETEVDPMSEMNNWKDEFKNNITNFSMSKFVENELQRRLNFIYGGTQVSIGKLNEKDIENLIFEAIKEKIGNVLINRDTLTAYGTQHLDRMEEIDKNINDINKITTTINELKKNLLKIQNISGNLTTREQDFLNKTQDFLKDYNLLTDTAGLPQLISDGGFIKTLNTIIQLTIPQNYNKLSGDIAEYYTALSSVILEQKTEQDVNKIITDFLQNVESVGVKGQKRQITQVLVDGNKDAQHFFTTKIDRDLYGSRSIRNDVKFSATQNKVDVELNVKDNKGAVQNILASVKNVNLDNTKYGINLLSGKNLLYYLQGYDRYAAHAFNILAGHYGKTKEVMDEKNKNGWTALDWAAFRNIKMALFSAALLGNVFIKNGNGVGRADSANIFILHNSGSATTDKRFKVYYMDEILGEVIKNIDKIEEYATISFNGKSSSYNFAGINKFQNKKIGRNRIEARRRVGVFFSKLISMRLKVSLKKSALSSMNSF